MKITYLEIHSDDKMWVVNDGEYIIDSGETAKYAVADVNSQTVYENDNFEQCLIWIVALVNEKQK